MKTYLNISIDIDVLIKAREKIKNLSGFVENVLREYINLPEEKQNQEISSINNELLIAKIRVSELEKRKEALEKEEKKKIVVELVKER